jgi:hypothetical protein
LHPPDDLRTFDPCRPDAIPALNQELVDLITRIDLKDEEAARPETILTAEGNRIARFDIVFHVFSKK